MSLFQKRHYEWLAAELRSAIEQSCGEPAVESVAINIAAGLARDNPNFNRDHFEKACGLTVVLDSIKTVKGKTLLFKRREAGAL